MLVLSRCKGESIVIGKDIKLTIVRANGERVRVAIEAPREVSIRRGELGELGEIAERRPVPRTADGRREEVNVEDFYDDGLLGGGNAG